MKFTELSDGQELTTTALDSADHQFHWAITAPHPGLVAITIEEPTARHLARAQSAGDVRAWDFDDDVAHGASPREDYATAIAGHFARSLPNQWRVDDSDAAVIYGDADDEDDDPGLLRVELSFGVSPEDDVDDWLDQVAAGVLDAWEAVSSPAGVHYVFDGARPNN